MVVRASHCKLSKTGCGANTPPFLIFSLISLLNCVLEMSNLGWFKQGSCIAILGIFGSVFGTVGIFSLYKKSYKNQDDFLVDSSDFVASL